MMRKILLNIKKPFAKIVEFKKLRKAPPKSTIRSGRTASIHLVEEALLRYVA